MAPLMKAIGQRFRKLHPSVEIEIETGGSGKGIQDARHGRCDIGMSSRGLRSDERDLTGFALARDGVCLIVHASNPITSLSKLQVADVFTGKVSNWMEVGGRNEPIHALNRFPSRSEVELFCQFFKVPERDGFKASATLGDNDKTIQAVVEDVRAITYVSLGEAEREARNGKTIKLLRLNGVKASHANVRNGNFAFSRPLILVTRDLPTGTGKAFVEFAMSPQVIDVIEEYNFIPYLD